MSQPTIFDPPTIYKTLRVDGPEGSGRYAQIHNSGGADLALLRDGEPVDSHDGWSFAHEVDAYRAMLAWLYHGELPENEWES